MTGSDDYSAEHVATTMAPAERAYGLVADVTRWPLIFAPCLYVDVLERGEGSERFRMWVTAGGNVRSWISRRRLDDGALSVEFEQENPTTPFASVAGNWRFESAGDITRIVLGHRWSVLDPTSEIENWVSAALERNSTQEVDALRFWAERSEDLDDLVFSFTDEVTIDAPAEQVYDFLYQADLWPERVPHVARLDLETTDASDVTAGADVQTMEMDTKAPDGTTHTTRSIRLCFAGERIVYKQIALPAGLLAHNGAWVVTAEGTGTRVSARHDVALDPEALTDVFGADATPADVRAKVTETLRTNSLRTLDHAREYAETPAVTRT